MYKKEDLKKVTIEKIEKMKDSIIESVNYLYENPEISGQEKLSCEYFCKILEENKFIVERNYLGIDFAFKAVKNSKKDGATVAFLAEYDALPEMGHGCGHNLIGTIGVSSGIALGELLDEVEGQIIVFGCPAEETNGAKIEMSEKGAFDNVDVAMMAHPERGYYESGNSLAMEAIRFEYFGKSSHAATCPEEGINALDGVIGLFNGINALRQHIKSDARIHGVIKNGGSVANIVPEYACAEFYIRARTREYLDELSQKIKKCGEASAMATGATVKISNYEETYNEMITNKNLSKLFTENLKSLGCKSIDGPRPTLGSLDMGNVSGSCPSIHPYFDISNGMKVSTHSKEFADCTITSYAIDQAILTIKALSITGLNILTDKDILKDIKEEFENR